MELYEAIKEKVYDSTTAIFAEFQKNNNIESGDVSMMDEIDLDDAIGELAEVIERCIMNQLKEVER